MTILSCCFNIYYYCRTANLIALFFVPWKGQNTETFYDYNSRVGRLKIFRNTFRLRHTISANRSGGKEGSFTPRIASLCYGISLNHTIRIAVPFFFNGNPTPKSNSAMWQRTRSYGNFLPRYAINY